LDTTSLGVAVDVVGKRFVRVGFVGPVGGELLVGASPQQDRVRFVLIRLDELHQLVVEAGKDRLLRQLDDAVQRHEKPRDEFPHPVRLLLSATARERGSSPFTPRDTTRSG
jgi:hypothetical protein